MVICMKQYTAAKAAPAAHLKDGAYGDEIMYANWNPAVLHMTRETAHAAPNPRLPDDLSTVDAGAFLDRVYALATLI
jgi:hypothetical protein